MSSAAELFCPLQFEMHRRASSPAVIVETELSQVHSAESSARITADSIKSSAPTIRTPALNRFGFVQSLTKPVSFPDLKRSDAVATDFISRTGVIMDVDLHGFHPCEISAVDLVRQAWEMGVDKIVLIHGHGHHRGISVGFVNTNTGYFGLEIRRALRCCRSELKKWAVTSSLDCSHPGATSIRLRSNPSPNRSEIELPEMTTFSGK